MSHRIVAVLSGSIADQCGIQPGDTLLTINGQPVLDQIDYQAMTATEQLALTLQTQKDILELHLEKDEAEPLGLQFESTLMSHPRVCANHCAFCFIDQMPPGMRSSLYVKDDDWRLSLMMGNYITLTNLSEAEMSRIIARKASPLYISIHATNGQIRAELMGNPRANSILPQLQRFAAAGIRFHCQVVLCPGRNDGNVLDHTLEDLASLYPFAQSAALVPVGLTRYRDGLAPLTAYTQTSARALLTQAHAWQQRFLARLGTSFVFPADEFYCLSDLPLPNFESYENFPQIENGVGLLAQFEQEFVQAADECIPHLTENRHFVLATGTSVAPFFRRLLARYPIAQITVEVLAIQNRFFGETVTVTGLITGQDLVMQLRDVRADAIFISSSMLRQEDQVFLDDMTLAQVREALHTPIIPVIPDGAELRYVLCGMEEE